LEISAKMPDGEYRNGHLLDAGKEASEVELLRTIAKQLGVNWGHDDLGWWAVVLDDDHTETERNDFCVYRQDDNGNKFLVESNLTESEANKISNALESTGHKQMYWVEDGSKP
jgi:hypothetical protein